MTYLIKLYHIVNKTKKEIEDKVIEIKKKTNYGPLRIKEELFFKYQIKLSPHTIRNIIRRNKKNINKIKKNKLFKKSPRPIH